MFDIYKVLGRPIKGYLNQIPENQKEILEVGFERLDEGEDLADEQILDLIWKSKSISTNKFKRKSTWGSEP